MTPLYFPRDTGFAALRELEFVPWGKLAHAYGTGVTGLGVAHDVRAALLMLGTAPEQALRDGLHASVCHRGTVYEATAYVVPFVAALAAGAVEPGLRVQLALLLGYVARSASFGSRTGATGADVAVRINEALRGATRHLRAAAAHSDAQLAEVIHAVVAAAHAPSIEMSAFLDDTIERFEDTLGLRDGGA